MKKLILLLTLLISVNVIGQITTASYTNKGLSTPYINSSSYKLNGVIKEFSQWISDDEGIYYPSTNGSTTYSVGIGSNATHTRFLIYDYTTPTSAATKYGLKIESNVNRTETVGNYYSLYINSAHSGDNYPPINYGIYVNSGGGTTNYPAILMGGNVGINKTNPGYTLDVVGEINALNYYQNGVIKSFSQWVTSSNDIYYTTGKVGIGNASPNQTLDVVGNIKTSTYLMQQGIFAEIYCADASTAQSIPTGTTYTKLTHWTNNGESANCTADADNDKITITKVGYYEINANSSSSAGTSGVEFRFAVFAGGTEISKIHSWSKFSNSNDKRQGSIHGYYHATSVPVDIDVRARHGEGGSVNLTIVYSNMTVKYIGE